MLAGVQDSLVRISRNYDELPGFASQRSPALRASRQVLACLHSWVPQLVNFYHYHAEVLRSGEPRSGGVGCVVAGHFRGLFGVQP